MIERKETVGLNKVLKDFSEYYNISVKEVKSKDRKHEIVMIRMLFCYCIKEIYKAKFSLREIGNTIDRNHATVIYAIKTIQNRIKVNDREVEDMLSESMMVIKKSLGIESERVFKVSLEEIEKKLFGLLGFTKDGSIDVENQLKLFEFMIWLKERK